MPAAVRPVLNLSNVEISCDGAACAWGAGAAPEYVRVDVVNYRKAWLWNVRGAPLPPPEPLSSPVAGPAMTVLPVNGAYDIPAGSGKQVGSNLLLHSFSQFNLARTETANFTGLVEE